MSQLYPRNKKIPNLNYESRHQRNFSHKKSFLFWAINSFKNMDYLLYKTCKINGNDPLKPHLSNCGQTDAVASIMNLPNSASNQLANLEASDYEGSITDTDEERYSLTTEIEGFWQEG